MQLWVTLQRNEDDGLILSVSDRQHILVRAKSKIAVFIGCYHIYIYIYSIYMCVCVWKSKRRMESQNMKASIIFFWTTAKLWFAPNTLPRGLPLEKWEFGIETVQNRGKKIYVSFTLSEQWFGKENSLSVSQTGIVLVTTDENIICSWLCGLEDIF